MAQVGIEVALKPYFTLSSVFRKPKDAICDEKKCGLVYEFPCRDCDAVYVGETGRSLSTRKKEHVKAVKEMNLQKSALSQHIVTCDHFIAWDDAYILKIELHYRKRRIAENFLINKRAKVVNVLNGNDGLVLPSIYSMLLDKIFFFLTICFIFPSIYYTMNFYFICLKIKKIFIPVTYFSIIVMIVIGGRNLALSMLCNIIPPVGLLLFTYKSI